MVVQVNQLLKSTGIPILQPFEEVLFEILFNSPAQFFSESTFETIELNRN
jgi:hypothetical protein